MHRATAVLSHVRVYVSVSGNPHDAQIHRSTMDSVVTYRMSVIGSETVCHASASLAGSKHTASSLLRNAIPVGF